MQLLSAVHWTQNHLCVSVMPYWLIVKETRKATNSPEQSPSVWLSECGWLEIKQRAWTHIVDKIISPTPFPSPPFPLRLLLIFPDISFPFRLESVSFFSSVCLSHCHHRLRPDRNPYLSFLSSHLHFLSSLLLSLSSLPLCGCLGGLKGI